MFEFFSEFTDRTERSRSSIWVLRRCASLAASPVAASPPGLMAADVLDPKAAKYWKCVWASAAA